MSFRYLRWTVSAIAIACAACQLGGTASAAEPIRVLVWDEQQPEQKQAYGDKFLGETIAAYLASQRGLSVKSVRMNDPQQGLDDATLDATDVLVVWSHVRTKEQ